MGNRWLNCKEIAVMQIDRADHQPAASTRSTDAASSAVTWHPQGRT
jgi:hypothetical protein